VLGSARIALLLAVAFTSAVTGQPQRERAPPAPPIFAQSLAPLLAAWISSERDAAITRGVEPIPPRIRAALTGYVPSEILDRVRWREGASELSLPQNVIRFGEVPAITLIDVIVFEQRSAALDDPTLWAHELMHVMQFAEWGIDGFSMRYLSDYEAVEAEAWEFRWQFMKQAGLVPEVELSGDQLK
jgi:hypothetical protein